jgi:spore coat protein U-like protein
MKKILIAAAIASALGVSTSAVAGNTQTMAVSATIAGTCKLQSATALAFGTIDPSVAIDAITTATVTYKCTNGLAPTALTGLTATGANDSLAQKRMLNGTTNFLNYQISFTSPTATGNGFGSGSTANTVTITGKILATDFQNASALTYNDTLTFTIAP